MATATLGTVEGLRQLEAKRAADYQALVLNVAHDREVDPSNAEQVLIAAQKSSDSLLADVEKLQGRMVLRSKFEAARDAAGRTAGLRAKLDSLQAAAKAEHERITRTLRQDCSPVAEELETAQHLALQAQQLQKQLFESCPDEALRSRYRFAVSSLVSIERELKEANSRLHDAKMRGEEAQRRGDAEAVKLLAERVVRHTATLQDLAPKRDAELRNRDDAYEAMLEI